MSLWWLRLARYARPYSGQLALMVLLMLTSVGLATLMPWPLKLIVDYTLTGSSLPENAIWITALPGGSSPTGLLGWLAASTVLLFLVHRVVGMTQGYIQAGTGTRMVYALAADQFNHLQHLSLRVHGRQRSGDLVRRVTTDSGCVRDLIMGVFLPVLTSVASLVIMFTVMWHLDRFLSLVAFLAAVPLPVLIKLFTPRMIEREYEQERLEGQVMAFAEQTLTTLPVVQAFGREAYEDRRFRALSGRTIHATLRALSAQLQFGVAVNAPTAVGTAAMLVLGGYHVLQGSLSVGSLLVFLAYLNSLYGPIAALASLSSGFASAAARSRRVMEILEMDEAVRDKPGAKPLPILPPGERGHVRLEDVTFGYQSHRAVLKGVTLEACPGETIALVGPTGVGKSTLVSLILRFFDPWGGRVVVDGMDVRDVKLASLRAQVALVLQEPFLLPLTIAENIAYGWPEASRDEVVAAAVAANANEFIRRLPEGYDTVIGERGATLSGGEKQRLAIARALLKDAPILILDEPTSALDAQTEASLLKALERLMAGRTTFIIAHRLSTIRNADRIVVLEDGKIVETGSHQQLLSAGTFYHRYYHAQHGQALANAVS